MTLRPGLGATYRVQLGPGLSFDAAARRVPYLARLGVETVYASPIAEAVPGSPHGYDGTDPTVLRAELGGTDGYRALVEACEEAGLGLCVDLVPNHLAAWPGGPWWRRVLAEGPDSDLAPVFDITWDAGVPGKVTLPLLTRPLATALADGTVRLGERDGEAVLEVGAVDLPVSGGRPRPGDSVGDVLAAQHYRLVDWHDVGDRNYRRFFDIDGLVGVRVETPEVFERTHALVTELARRGWLSAVRVDHVDGLREPGPYLRRLGAAVGVPVVVEKILSGDEWLPADWPVAGTTGYEVMDDLGGALVDADGLDRLVAQARAEGEPDAAAATVDARRLVAENRFPGELGRLAGRLGVAADDLAVVASRLTRYRTYLGAGDATPADEAEWRGAARRAGAPAVADAVLDPHHRPAALRLQQLTGAIMAKGVEDTAWYRLAGPLPFCEVGGDPARDRHDGAGRLHRRAAARAADGRVGLVPGTTHDTKRAQDVRCRLYALTEVPDAFAAGLAELRRALDTEGDLAEETRLLAQLVLGILPPQPPADAGGPRWLGDAAWPEEDCLARRFGAALTKSAREAKSRSSWTAPDEAYEARLRALGSRALADRAALVHASFGPTVAEVARLGAVNALSSLVLRCTLPGVPDCYEGDETWDLSLVDPDNRRPVDFERLAQALDGFEDAPTAVAALRRSWRDGRVKLHVTSRCLRARRRAGGCCDPAAPYLPLAAHGPAAGSALSLARHDTGGRWLVAVTTRRASALAAPDDDLPAGPSYADTVLALPPAAPGTFVEMLTGRPVVASEGELALEEVLADLPVALLLGPSPSLTP